MNYMEDLIKEAEAAGIKVIDATRDESYYSENRSKKLRQSCIYQKFEERGSNCKC